MPLIGESQYQVGQRAYVVFTFTPATITPLAECTAVIVDIMKPDGSRLTYSSPHSSLVKTTSTALVDNITRLITTWTFTFPAPFDIGSDRKEWQVRCRGVAGVLGVTTSARWVAPDPFV